MVSYRVLALGASPVELGAVAAAFAVLSFVFAVPVGRWIDRHGEGRFVVLGAVLTAGVAFALVGTDSLFLLGLTQALLGLGHVLMTVAIQTLIANSDEPARRDTRFGAFTVVVSFGQLAGPALAGVLAGQGVSVTASPQAAAAGVAGAVRVFAVAGGAAVLACLLAATLWRAAPSVRSLRPGKRAAGEPVAHGSASDGRTAAGTARPSIARVLRLPSMPQAMFASVAVLTSSDILVVYLPAYGQAAGLSVATVGFLLATRSAASLVARMFMAALVAWLGRGPVLVACAAVPAVTLALVPLSHSSPLLFVLIALAGLGLGLGQPLSLAWVAGKAPRGVRGTALAVRLSGNRLGQVVVPAAIGGLVGLTGPGVIFWALTSMLAASSALSSRATFDR